MQKDPFEKIPHGFLIKWQEIADLIANIINVPAALIMKTENEFMEVFTSSNTANNPYSVGNKEHWHGLYCETVINSQKKLHIPNALKSKNWRNNPDLKTGMIAYLGFPVNFPDKKPFGTLCVLDNKERHFTEENEKLLQQFRKVLELDLALILTLKLEENFDHAGIIQKLSQDNEELRTTHEKLKKTRDALKNSEATIKNKLKAILEPEGDIGKLNLADIIDKEELQAILDNFRKITNIGSAILDVSGKVLVSTQLDDICAKFHSVHSRTAKNCLKSDPVPAGNGSRGTFSAYRCKNNMWDMVSPIIIGGKYMGNICMGQFFYEDEHVDYESFRKQARKHGFDEKEYLAAVDRVPRLRREMVDSAMTFFVKLTDMISSLSYSKIELSRDIAGRKQAEKRNNLLASIIERSNDFIGVADINQKAMFVNKAGQIMLGLEGEEAVRATKIEDYFMPEDLPFVRETIIPTLNKEGRWSGEFRLRHFKTGLPVPVLYDLFKTIDQDTGEVSNISTVTRDISQIKQAESEIKQSQQLLQSISDNMFDQVALTDMNGVYTFVGASHKILGYEANELIGTNVMEYVHPDDLPFVMAAFKEFTDNKEDNKKVIYRNRCADGSYLWFETVGRFIYDEKGNPRQILFNSRDITERKKADEALRESEERFRMIAELAPVGIIITDETQNPAYVSPAFTKIFGYTIQDMPGVGDWFLLAYPDENIRNRIEKEWFEFIETVKSEGGTYKPLEYPVLCKNGSVKQIEFRLAISGNTHVIIFTDITERMMAEKAIRLSESRFRNAFDHSAIGMALISPEGKWLKVNKRVCDILGYGEDELMHKTFQDITHPEDLDADLEFVRSMLAGEIDTYHLEKRYFHKDGRIIWTLLAVSLVWNERGAPLHFISQIVDITQRKKAEEIHKELDVANKTAKFKQNFLANMSHEIRTPLTGVLGMIEIMEQTSLTHDQKDYLDIIKSSGENLREIINQVLDYSKIEAGRVSIHPRIFEFASLPVNAISLYKNNVKAGVKLHSSIDPNIPAWIEADNARLSQVLNNLVSNALKFTSQGAITIDSSLVFSNSETGHVIIKVEVSDTGIGIPEDLQKKLFVPFSQVEVMDIRNYEGTGLGLSICKQLVEIMDGEIGVTSEEGKGSTFWFTFPAKTACEQQLNKEKSGTLSEKKLNILLAEDKVVNQKVISLMLLSLGHHTTIACNGQEAIDLFESGKFDLILMDIQMPVMDGVTATQQLKKTYTNLPPIVGLSANAFEGDREKYMALGMDEYLTKPVKKDDFESMIVRIGIA